MQQVNLKALSESIKIKGGKWLSVVKDMGEIEICPRWFTKIRMDHIVAV